MVEPLSSQKSWGQCPVEPQSAFEGLFVGNLETPQSWIDKRDITCVLVRTFEMRRHRKGQQVEFGDQFTPDNAARFVLATERLDTIMTEAAGPVLVMSGFGHLAATLAVGYLVRFRDTHVREAVRQVCAALPWFTPSFECMRLLHHLEQATRAAVSITPEEMAASHWQAKGTEVVTEDHPVLGVIPLEDLFVKKFFERQEASLVLMVATGAKLWLGNRVAASDVAWLTTNSIHTVVNCAPRDEIGDVPPEVHRAVPEIYENGMIEYRRHDNEPMLRAGAKLIYNRLCEGKSVMVHCWAGVNRSSSTIATYLMMYHDMSLAQAIKFLQHKRAIVYPNPEMWATLRQLEVKLRTASSVPRHIVSGHKDYYATAWYVPDLDLVP